MQDDNRDLATLLEDVKTIKSILQSEDAPLPRMWVVAWIVGPVMAVGGLIQYFVPFYRDQNFDGLLLWLWVPVFCVLFPGILLFLAREIGKTGKKFLGQSRVRHLLFARFVIPPAALILVWLLARHPTYSLEGAVFLVIAIWLTAIEQVFPPPFRSVPVGFLALGLLELSFQATGREVTLFNTLLLAGNFGLVGLLFRWQQARSP